MLINMTHSSKLHGHNQTKKKCSHRMIQPVITGSMSGYVRCSGCGVSLDHIKLVFSAPNEATIDVSPLIRLVEIDVNFSTKTLPSE